MNSWFFSKAIKVKWTKQILDSIWNLRTSSFCVDNCYVTRVHQSLQAIWCQHNLTTSLISSFLLQKSRLIPCLIHCQIVCTFLENSIALIKRSLLLSVICTTVVHSVNFNVVIFNFLFFHFLNWYSELLMVS